MRPEKCLEAEQAPVALVFGRERVGLTNDELQKCHYHVAIAANLNTAREPAMAVQVIAYEVDGWLATRRKWQNRKKRPPIRWWTIWSASMVTEQTLLYRFYPRRPSGAGDE